MELGESSDTAPADAGGEEGAPAQSSEESPNGARAQTAHSAGRQAGTDDPDDGKSDDKPEGEPKQAKKQEEKPPEKPKTRKRKLMHRGEEIDFDPDDDDSVEQLAQRLGRPYKVKIGGEERERSLEEVLRDAAHVGGANAKFEEAAGLKRQHEQWLQQVQADPLMIKPYLQNALGLDPYKVLWAEVQENERIESLNRPDPNLSAEENAARQRQYQQVMHERMRQEAIREVQQQQAQENARRIQQENQRQLQAFVQAMPVELEKHGLSIDSVTGPVSAKIKAQMEKGGQEATPEAVAYQTKRALEGYAARHLPTDPEKLLEAIGAERLDALKKYWTKAEKDKLKAKARGDGSGSSSETPPSKPQKKNSNTGTLADIEWG